MKKSLILIMGAATLAMPMHAQEESNASHYSILDHLMFDLDATVGLENKGMTPTTLNFALGYQLTPRFFAFAKTEGSINLYKKDDVKTYFKSQALGGGLGFKLFNPKTTAQGVDLRLSVTNTIGNADWKYTSYNADLILYPNCKKSRSVPYIGLGFRHINSHTSGLSNWNGITGTIGFRF